jgi:hypothetical protein
MKRPAESDFDPMWPMISRTPGGDADRRILRLVGVYDADGTLRGELAYWVGARLGRTHCALCDITHGLTRERSEWKTCRESLPVPFDAYHRDDQPEEVSAASRGVVPVVLAETDDGFVVLLGPEELSECAGSVGQLTGAIESAVARTGLT